MKQTVAHKKLSAVEGIALIIALLVALLLLNAALSLLSAILGPGTSTLLFWGSGTLIAYWMMRTYVAAYCYELTPDVLRITRKYAKRERYLEDIYLNALLFVGTPEEAAARYPQAKKVSAIHKSAGLAVTAVVQKPDTQTRIVLLQPDEALRAKLVERVRRK